MHLICLGHTQNKNKKSEMIQRKYIFQLWKNAPTNTRDFIV